MQVQAQKWPRPQQTHRQIDVRSDWSDLDDGKDNQARDNPIIVDVNLDHETNIDQQPSTSNPNTSTPLKRPNAYPKVLCLGRGRGKFPLANWMGVSKGCGCELLKEHDIPQAPSVHQEPMVERNLAIAAPTDRLQIYEGNLAQSKSRKDLANWSWVRLGNTKASLTNNNNNRMEQRQWQRPDNNNDDRTLDETGGHANTNPIEWDVIHRDEERPGLEDLEEYSNTKEWASSKCVEH